MRPVKIVMKGKFWDSQIYSGVLLLFTEDGSIQKIDWRSHINVIADQNQSCQTALRVAFMDGDLFYNDKVRRILKDPAIDSAIRSQLDRLSKDNLEVPVSCGGGMIEVTSPFQFYPTDTDVYYSSVIAAGEEGLFSFPMSKVYARAKPSGTRHHDASFLRVKASPRYTAVAATAGDDGLFEFGFGAVDEESSHRHVLAKHKILSNRSCKGCEWSFESVLAWTETNAFLAKFKEETFQREKRRIFDEIVDINDIFLEAGEVSRGSAAFSWGAREKLYRFGKDGISVVDLISSKNSKHKGAINGDSPKETVHYRGTIQVGLSEDEVIATGTAPFGSVMELSDRVLVLRSDGVNEVFPGEVVHWRIFPRSDHYSNQLHLIYDDRIEIVSFVHDYFVDQGEKLSGFSRGSGTEIRTDSFL